MQQLEEEKAYVSSHPLTVPVDNSKKEDLLKDFSESGWAANREINLDELCSHVEVRMRQLSRNEAYFLLAEERKAIEKLFRSIDKNNDGYIEVYFLLIDLIHRNEFVEGLMEYQAFCASRQAVLQGKMNEISSEINELLMEKETEEAHKESFSKLLKVDVVEASRFSEDASFYVVVHFENQTFKTKPAPGPSPAWEEVFTLYYLIQPFTNSSVFDPNEKVNIAVWCETGNGSDTFKGICVGELPEDHLNDQEMVTEWKTLVDEEGQPIPQKVKIGIQYLFDPIKLIDAQIRMKEEEKFKFREELNQLTEFGKKAAGSYFILQLHYQDLLMRFC
eukprot:TRINITY_DN120935_c1_g1_i1.p1 TRINITY_DN120935_c1_g1~~TRINITY_DN120935_c1_g1_i1.p1  ORF type:complete len:333 (+),score=44.07 TRINITY_DN120935_c1_g1_i1:2452-3450(+)